MIQVEVKDADQADAAELDALDAEIRSVLRSRQARDPRRRTRQLRHARRRGRDPRLADARRDARQGAVHARQRWTARPVPVGPPVAGRPGPVHAVGAGCRTTPRSRSSTTRSATPTRSRPRSPPTWSYEPVPTSTRCRRERTTPTMRDAALASGAQWVSTDYEEPNPAFSPYAVQIPDGTPARCNPVTARRDVPRDRRRGPGEAASLSSGAGRGDRQLQLGRPVAGLDELLRRAEGTRRRTAPSSARWSNVRHRWPIGAIREAVALVARRPASTRRRSRGSPTCGWLMIGNEIHVPDRARVGDRERAAGEVVGTSASRPGPASRRR